MEIDLILDQIFILSPNSKNVLKSYISEIHLPKGHLLISAHKVEPSIYFIKHGIARAYSDRGENEITFWFGKEGDTIISMKNYVSNQKSYENIELLENCDLYKLNTKDLQKLFLDNIEIANWGRKFAEQELVKTEERLISRLNQTATERYVELIQNYPHLIQRVQLGYIASYLGITQVSLSRIRAQLK